MILLIHLLSIVLQKKLNKNILMKTIILALLITLLTVRLYGDVGSCVRYQVGITLVNNKYIEGFVYAKSYQPRFKFDDICIKDYIINKCLDDKKRLELYLSVKEIIYPKLKNYSDDCDLHFNAAPEDQLKLIDACDINDVKLIELNTCHNCDKYDFEEGFCWIGIYPNVITELTKKEIKLLQKEPVASNDFYYPWDEFSQFKILSYNKSIDLEALKKASDDYLKSVEPYFVDNNWEKIRDSYNSFKVNLRKQNVIVFEIGFVP